MTATSLPFMGAELGEVDPSDSSVIENTSTASFLQDKTAPGTVTWARCSIKVGGGPASYLTSPTWSATANIWDHFVYTNDQGLQSFSGQTIKDYFSGTGATVARITADYSMGAAILTFHFWTSQGGTLINNGSVAFPFGVHTVDINAIGNSVNGFLYFYLDGNLRATYGPIDHSGWSGIAQWRCYGVKGSLVNIGTYWSEMITAGDSTIGNRLFTERIDTLSGTNNGWTGGVTNINGIVTNDASVISASSANLTDTFYQNGLSFTGYTILAMGVGARVSVQGSGPAHTQLVIRSGSTNYNSSSISVISGFQACFHSWTTDPHTSSAWTAANAAAAEGGLESIT